MKIALVHELLTRKGGAERVLKIAAAMFPGAPIYTLLYDEALFSDWFPPARVHTSSAQRSSVLCPLSSVRFSHHLHLRRFPRAVEAWDFSAFDLVLSFSSAFVHGIITNGAPPHLCYVHSPARYLWDRTHDVLERAGCGMLGWARRPYLSRTFHRLRTWDAESAARPGQLLAASAEVKRRIELYWRRESLVLHPPLDDFWLRPTTDCRLPTTDSYYLIVSQLAAYKRIDLAIEACNRLNVPLKIAGTGPDEGRLKRLSGPTVEFLGFRKDDNLRGLYAHARATIFPGDEDFGLVPLESQACGTPVIAYRGGGALETIADGVTGTFFDEPTAAALAAGIASFDPQRFRPAACRAQAAKHSPDTFKHKLMEEVERCYSAAR